MRFISTVSNRIYYLNSFFIIFLENIYRNTCDSTISTRILVLPLIMLARNNVIFNLITCLYLGCMCICTKTLQKTGGSYG